MATQWTVTRLVGFQLGENGMCAVAVAGTNEEVPNSVNPDLSLTGQGRKGKMRAAFILSCVDLRHQGEFEDDALLSFTVPCPISFQNPPSAVAPATSATYLNGEPLDRSTYLPITKITSLIPSNVTQSSREAKPYLIVNNDTLAASRRPVAVSSESTAGATPNFLAFQFGTLPMSSEGAVAGSFLIEIDFSHSIAS